MNNNALHITPCSKKISQNAEAVCEKLSHDSVAYTITFSTKF